MNHEGGDAGYTLLELLLVIAIMASITAAVPVMLPSIGLVTPLQRATETLVQEFKTIRLIAMQKGSVEKIIYNKDKGSLTHDVSENLTLEFDPKVQISMVAWDGAASVQSISFFANGRSTGGTMVLRHADQVRYVRVSPITGLIRPAS